jgi:hypothetical protein
VYLKLASWTRWFCTELDGKVERGDDPTLPSIARTTFRFRGVLVAKERMMILSLMCLV